MSTACVTAYEHVMYREVCGPTDCSARTAMRLERALAALRFRPVQLLDARPRPRAGLHIGVLAATYHALLFINPTTPICLY